MEERENSLATVRLRLPYDDEPGFVAGYAGFCRAGTLFLPSRKEQSIGTRVRFELLSRGGGRLMLGEGRVVEGTAPAGRAGFFVRVVRLDARSKGVYRRLKEAPAGGREVSREVPPVGAEEAGVTGRGKAGDEALATEGSSESSDDSNPYEQSPDQEKGDEGAEARGNGAGPHEDRPSSGMGGDGLERSSDEEADSGEATAHECASSGQVDDARDDEDSAGAKLSSPEEAVNEQKAHEAAAIGVDLGTSRARAATVLDDAPRTIELGPEGLPWMPVGVVSGPGDELLVGSEVPARRAEQPDQVVLDVKRLLGRSRSSPIVRRLESTLSCSIVTGDAGEIAVSLARCEPTITEVGAKVLEGIRIAAEESLGRRCPRAVLAVPSGFGDRQRRALREAARLAGLDVLRVVSGPVAAAIAYGAGKGIAAKRLAVLDLGAGYLDISVLTISGDSFEVVGSAGELFVGGNEIDECICERLSSAVSKAGGPESLGPGARQKLLAAAEAAKIALDESDRYEVRIPALWRDEMTGEPRDFESEVTRDELESWCGGIVERVVKSTRGLLTELGLEPEQIDELLLVGGQSRMPLIRRALQELFGGDIRSTVDPEEAVALGCAVLARTLDREDDDPTAPEIHLTDVLSSPISVGLPGGRLMAVVEKGTRIPCERTIQVETRREGQGSLEILLFQGGRDRMEEAEYLGAVTFDDLGEGSAGTSLRLRLTIDEEGRLSVRATDDDTGEERPHSFSSAGTFKEVEERLNRLDAVIRDVAGPGAGLMDVDGDGDPDGSRSGRGLFGGLRRRLFGRRA